MGGNPVLASALNRALLLAALTGLLSTLTAYQQGNTWEDSIIAGVVVAITAIIARLGIEGGYDQHRANTGNVKAGDVPEASDKTVVTKV
mgnify:CR=1 FL=1